MGPLSIPVISVEISQQRRWKACVTPLETGNKRRSAVLLSPSTHGYELISESDLKGDFQNQFEIRGEHCFTHMRLRLFRMAAWRVRAFTVKCCLLPHGPARVRVGNGLPKSKMVAECWRRVTKFYSAPLNLLMSGRSKVLHLHGWDVPPLWPGPRSAIIKLAGPVRFTRIEVEISHFKGNHP